jgi:hypothetical protein
MKKLALLIPLLALSCTGCLSTNVTQFAAAMGTNNATIAIKINTVYGTASFIRVGGTETNVSKTVSPDGTITIKQ